MNIGPNIGQSFRLVFTFSQYNTYFAHRIQQPIFKLQTLNFYKFVANLIVFEEINNIKKQAWKLSAIKGKSNLSILFKI